MHLGGALRLPAIAGQPGDLLLSSGRAERLVILALAAVLLILLAVLGAWIRALKRQLAERQGAEAAARHSEERFAKAFQASPDCIAIGDANGIIEVNDQFTRLTGYERSEVIGRPISDLGLMSEADRNDVVQTIFREGSLREREYQIRIKDGTFRTVVMSSEVMHVDGRACYLTVNRDVTGARDTAAALIRSEAKYRDLVENADDFIFTVDSHGYCLGLNSVGARITGLAAGDRRGTHLSQFVAAEHMPIAGAMLKQALEGQTVPSFELDILTQDRTRLTFDVSVRAVSDGDRPVAVQGIARDVTARRALESQLRQAQKMEAVGRLTAGVAHDFNNLLTIILGSCEAAGPMLSPGDPVAARLDDIRVAGGRGADLTRQLLAFSRRQIMQPAVLDLNTVVGNIDRIVSRIAGEHVDLRFDRSADLGCVSADPGYIQQVVLNLVVNARDAMPNGGRLVVATRNLSIGDAAPSPAPAPPGQYVALTVTDTGIGMDEDTRARLFEPFFTTKPEGTGLGLATVHSIVQQCGGSIAVTSAAGAGSTFAVLLPRIEGRPESARSDPARELPLTGTGNVLLVEDEDDLRDLLHECLSRHGYAVQSAASGEAGLALAQGGFRPTLVVSDVVMRGMGGRGLVDRMRSSDPGLRVLYLSGYTDEAVLRQGPLPPHTRFLQKPFTLAAFAGEVRHLLGAAESEAA